MKHRNAISTVLEVSCVCTFGFVSMTLTDAAQVEVETPGAVIETTVRASPDGIQPAAWAQIQAVHACGQYDVIRDGEQLTGINRVQDWKVSFDTRGVWIQSKDRSWSWGLQLETYGYDGSSIAVTRAQSTVAEGGRVESDWNANLQEWYIHGAVGLEHGFFLRERPARGAGLDLPLHFDLRVLGDLRGQVFSDGTGARFLDESGVPAITYTGLRVFDALGQDQSARMEMRDGVLRLVIDESQATYPLTIDPIAQTAYAKASNAEGGDRFGHAIAVDGNTVVVAAPQESSNATGVNGDQSNNDAISSGAVYVFERVGGVWSQTAYLKASNTEEQDRFGDSLALSVDTLVVGARHESSGSAGVNGDQTNNSMGSAGAAYVFVRNGSSWTQQAYLKASNPGNSDWFGTKVAIDGDTIVVGAPWESSHATGVGGNQADDSMFQAGAAYVFVRNVGVWSQQAYLKASNTEAGDLFGNAVDVSGATIVVGAFEESSSATGINGNQNNNDTTRSGAAYVFTRTMGVWSQQAYVKASSPGAHDVFGYSVSISGDRMLIGAVGESSNAVGIDGDQTNNSAYHSGAAYLFDRVGSTWGQVAYVKGSTTEQQGSFGGSVKLQGDRFLVGSHSQSSRAPGIHANQAKTNSPGIGAAFLFSKNAGVWTQEAFIKASNPGRTDYFGSCVGFSGTVMAVGAPSEESNATGLNGDQSDNSADHTGAAYFFDLQAPVGFYCATLEGNSTGSPATISIPGSIVVSDQDFRLRVDHLPLGEFGYFLNSTGIDFAANYSGSQGNLCLGGGAPIGRHNRMYEIRNSGTTGSYELALDLNDLPTTLGSHVVMAGETWNFQSWYRDHNPTSTSNFSDVVSVEFQ
ncbi:MAG: hypothetical protein GY930_06800 [bacterium]|nr:hypothetical protein [bacterium]